VREWRIAVRVSTQFALSRRPRAAMRYGRAQARDGIVIDMTQLRAVHEVKNDRIVVGAGARWSEVLGLRMSPRASEARQSYYD
jgi:hypothetical protein